MHRNKRYMPTISVYFFHVDGGVVSKKKWKIYGQVNYTKIHFK